MIPPIASRFVAGESDAAALEHARQLRERDVHAILNLLGEHYPDPEPAAADADAYRRLVRDIPDGLGACVSVKPSQIGLDLGTDTLSENLARIVEAAREEDVFVWMDMEDPDTVDATIDAFAHSATDYDRMGLCVQANLERTRKDLDRLMPIADKLRLVKGAYDPPPGRGYTDKSRVNDAYRELLDRLFEEYDGTVAVGSHDPAMITYAIDRHDELGTPFEIQMLMGVREDAQTELARDHDVYQYVPYGTKWFSYFYRRAVERKENLAFALRAVTGI